MSPPLDIRLLGDFRLALGEEPITGISAPRLQALIAYLALHPSPQPRAHMAFVFWPDSTERQALTNLRHLLHRLRKALPDTRPFVRADHQTLCLALEGADSVDVAEFRRAVRDASEARRGEDHARELRQLLRATDLYGGDLLPGCYDAWIDEDRRRLRDEYTGAVEALVRRLEARRDYASAIRFARRLRRHEPLREPTYRTLMRLHALAGDRAGVLTAYEECREMLAGEFGAGPAEATEKLKEQLLDGRGPVTVSADAAAGGEHPLVGRFGEWERLRNAWRRAQEGGSRLVAVTGEAGIGKTRLVDELFTWVRRQGAAAARSRSYAAAGRLAYAPIVDWLRTDALRARLADVDPIWLTEIARILPELRLERPDLPEPDAHPDEWDRRRLFDALTRAVTAGPGPLLLVLDDLQWTDPPSLEWLRYLLGHAGEAPILLAATIRSEEVGPELDTLLSDLRVEGQLDDVRLGPLSAPQSAEIAKHVSGRELSAPEVERLQAETEGNPLFVVETTRMQLQDDSPDAGAAATTAPAGRLPPKVQAIISRRLRQLSDDAAEVAGLAAVIGRSFPADVLARAGPRSREQLASALDELWRRRIVEETSVGRYDFTHDKLREVAYRELSPERRRVLHLRVAEALEREASDETFVHVAAHYEQAGRPGEAADYYRRAGDAARQVYAGAEAARLYRGALRLLEALPGSAERDRQELAIQMSLGACLVANAGYPAPEVRRTYGRARELCERLGEPVDAPVLRGMALSNISGGDLEEARRLGKELLALAESNADPVLVVEGGYVLGVTGFWHGRLAASRRHLEAALERYDPDHRRVHTALYAQDPRLICRCRLALTLWYLGEAGPGLTMVRESIAEAREFGHPHTFSYVLCFGTLLLLDARIGDQADRLTRECIGLAERHDLALWRELANTLQGWARAELGDVEGGAEAMRRAIAAYRAIGNFLGVPQFLGVLADLYRRTGRPDEARSCLEDAFAMAAERGERYYEPELCRLEGELLRDHAAGDAEERFRRSLAIAADGGARFLQLRAAMSLARLWRDAGRTGEAKQLLRETLGVMPDGPETRDRRDARGMLEALGRGA